MTAVATPIAFQAIGTTAILLVTEPEAADEAVSVLRGELAAIDAACSRFRPDSELCRLNAAAGHPMTVSPRFVEAIEVALRAAHLTAGRVDPTVGTAMRVIGYDRDFTQVHPARPAITVSVRPVPGWHLVRVDRARSTAIVPKGVELDLGATAKALCADRAAHAAATVTGSGVLVSLGGDVAVAGPPPGEGWRIRVADSHADPRDAPGQTILLTSGGLATSGTTVRQWQRGGARLHHIVDPATGRPAASCWRTVSVAAGSCVDANTASTAAIVLGPDAPAWLEEQGLPARLVGTDGTVVPIGSWPDDEELLC